MIDVSKKSIYHGKSALVVEPSDIMRSAMVKMLRELGVHPIHQSLKVSEAQRMLVSATPDIIISERDINGEDTIDFLTWCRQREETQLTPFVFCTSTVEQLSVIQALKAGVSEYIAKPFSVSSFQKHLTKALKSPLNSRFEEQFHHKIVKEEQLSITGYSQRTVELNEANFTILVVDDHVANIDIASRVIKKLGRVKFATDGASAIQMCNEFPPDLILLDIMMPNIDGYQVFESLKQNTLTANIPVIFVTGKADEEDIAKGLTLGAVDYVTKPINSQILHARVLNQKKQIELQKSLENQIDSYIDNFALKADLERILYDHVRAPLNTLHDVAYRLMQKSITNNKAVQEGIVLEKVRTTIERLIESLNSMVKIEDNAFKPNILNVDVAKTINNVQGELSKEVSEKCLSIDNLMPAHCYVEGDNTLLHTMFSSLLLNAIEAAPRGTQLVVFHKVTDSQHKITLYNRGGVDKSIVARFFDKYVTKGKVNGTGLGTYSAKLITEALGGRIELEGSEEETRVHIYLNKGVELC